MDVRGRDLEEDDDSIDAHVGEGVEIFLPLVPTVEGGLYEDCLVKPGDDSSDSKYV